MAETASMADEVIFDPHDPDHLLFMSELTAILESTMEGRAGMVPQASSGATGSIVSRYQPTRTRCLPPTSGSTSRASRSCARRRPTNRTRGEPWFNMFKSPDYAYAIETAPDGAVFTSYSPKKFEDFGAVWRYRGGPEGDPEGWEEVLRIPGASGVTDLAIGPGEPYTVYAGVTGQDPGVWASSDGGDTWGSVHNDGFDFVTVHAVAMDPRDVNVVYAAPWGDGLYRSADAGQSWMHARHANRLGRRDRRRSARAPVTSSSETAPARSCGRAGTQVSPGASLIGLRRHKALSSDVSRQDRRGPVRVVCSTEVPEGLAIFAGVPESGSTFRIGLDGPHPIEGLTRSVLSFSDQGDAVYAVTHLSGVYEIVNDVAIDISAGLTRHGLQQRSRS